MTLHLRILLHLDHSSSKGQFKFKSDTNEQKSNLFWSCISKEIDEERIRRTSLPSWLSILEIWSKKPSAHLIIWVHADHRRNHHSFCLKMVRQSQCLPAFANCWLKIGCWIGDSQIGIKLHKLGQNCFYKEKMDRSPILPFWESQNRWFVQ